jgi:ADP-ribose pyrophosphatase
VEKPNWHRRASSVVVDSPYMRLRMDELELPDGTVIPNYYVREWRGFVVIFATTQDGHVVLVRQYRYGTDAIHIELPAGMIDGDEDPRDAAIRELAEETGYAAPGMELAATYRPEPPRSNAYAYLYVARGATVVREPRLDASEVLEVELATLNEFRAMLKNGTIDGAASIAGGYRALDYLDRLA